MKSMLIQRSNTGKPAFWENGGGYTNTGEAQVVAGPNGERMPALFVRTGGHLACENHALVPLERGSYVITVYRSRDDFRIYVERVAGFDPDRDDKALVEMISEFSLGEWDYPPPPDLQPAIEAAKEKSREYHCRRAVFIKDNKDK